MTIARLQAVLAATSGLPEDAVVNSIHVDLGGVATPTEIEAACEAFRDFYNVGVGADAYVGSMLSTSIADNGHAIRAYEYDATTGERIADPGDPPEHVELFDFIGRGDETIGLPNEVALKVTFRNTLLPLVPLRRRTGGIFFGPLEGSVLTAGANGFAVPLESTINRLVNAADKLKDDLDANGTPLVVWSRPYEGRAEILRPGRTPLPAIPARDGAVYPVNQVFVDDEFDTIRKRGRRRGVRTIL